MKSQKSSTSQAGRIVSLVLAVTASIFLSAVVSHAATLFVVTSANDSNAPGTLRWAINSSNGSPGFDTIAFNIPGGGVRTINLTSGLPIITDPVYLDGTTQPGYSGTPIIELNGSSAGGAHGLRISAGNTVVLGLVINRFTGTGIYLHGSGFNGIRSCYIGISASGISDLGNSDGIRIDNTSPGNSIGGTATTSRNVISGNESRGLSLSSSGNVIRGNFIGTNAAGTAALPNASSGISLINASNNTIGGTTAGARNIISGNQADGIFIGGQTSPADANIVQGNYIGTDVTGLLDLGNSNHGIQLDRASNNIIGGIKSTGSTSSNLISGNGGIGIRITGQSGQISTGNQIRGNIIGQFGMPNEFYGIFIDNGSTDNRIGGVSDGEENIIFANLEGGIAVQSGTGNAILGNIIYQNEGPGIDLGVDGVTPNDAGDADTGGNNRQNFPLLSSVTTSGTITTFTGTLNSTANTGFRIEFFITPDCDPSGYGEGFDGSESLAVPSLITNGSGNASFTFSIFTAGVAPVGKFITATATDPSGNTSEFSPCAMVTAPGPGSFSLSFASKTVDENVVFQDVTIQRTGGNTGAVSVNFAATNGTATSPGDYTGPTTTYNFAPGETSKNVFITVINDTLDETDETVNLTLSNPTGGATLSNPSTATLTITDNDPPVALSISDVSLAESNSGQAGFSFNVTLAAASGHAVTVNYAAIAGGTATVGDDYQPASGMLTFAAGESSKPVTILVNGDTQDEPSETFFVQLSGQTNATLAKAQGIGTIINDDAVAPASLQFSDAAYSVQEGLTAINVTVTRNGDTTAAATVDYATSNGTADQKGDYEFAAGTLQFAPGDVSHTFAILINEDSYIEGTETLNLTLSNPMGGTLGAQSIAVLSITDGLPESASNPIDDAQTFVHTHYHDFLNREPDAAGLAFWTNQIASCGNDAQCIEVKRINVSAAYFLSIEFQQTGYLLYLFQKESFGSMPKYNSFMRDLQEVSQGVVVNSPGWEQKLAANQQQFAEKWVERPAFKAAYDNMSNAAYVNALYANAGVVPPQAERDALVTALDAATQTRAAVLLEVAGNAAFRQQEQNPAFVLMQYFGYLRRDPDSGPDSDLSGYYFWLTKLNAFNGDYLQAEMVKAFLTSIEYRTRFGQ